MAKYTSDTNLIRGAAIAYRNYDNAPGMYDGLDKVIETGNDIVKDALAKKEKNKAEDDLIRNSFNKLSSKVYEELGGLGKDDHTHAVGYMKELDKQFYDAQKNKDAEGLAAVNIDFSNYLSGIESQKQLRKDIAGDPNAGTGLSSAVKGDNLKIVNAWLQGNYNKKTNAEGKWEYTMNVEGIGEITTTEEEIKKIAISKDPMPNAAFVDQFDKIINKKNWDKNEKLLKYNIREKIVPKDSDELSAYLNDPGFGLEKGNFHDLMWENMERIIPEIDEAVISYFDTDKQNGISPEEYDNFVEAIVNPSHPFWQGDTDGWNKFSSQIAVDALANITMNSWNQMHGKQEVNTLEKNVKTTEVPDSLPPESYDYDGDNIGEGAPMDVGKGSAFNFDASKFNKNNE